MQHGVHIYSGQLSYVNHGNCLLQVREQGQQKGEASPFLAELLRLEEQAKQDGLGRWSQVAFDFNSVCWCKYVIICTPFSFQIP